MATSAQDLFDRAKNAADLQSLLKQGIGGSILAVFFGLTSGILSLADVVIKPVDALATALGDLTTAIFGGPAQIVLAGVQATAESILGPFNLGPLSFALSIAAVLAGLWVLSRYRDEEDTGNLIPGLPFDAPVVGEVEEDED